MTQSKIDDKSRQKLDEKRRETCHCLQLQDGHWVTSGRAVMHHKISDKDLNTEALKSASSTKKGDGKNEEQCDQV